MKFKNFRKVMISSILTLTIVFIGSLKVDASIFDYLEYYSDREDGTVFNNESTNKTINFWDVGVNGHMWKYYIRRNTSNITLNRINKTFALEHVKYMIRNDVDDNNKPKYTNASSDEYVINPEIPITDNYKEKGYKCDGTINISTTYASTPGHFFTIYSQEISDHNWFDRYGAYQKFIIYENHDFKYSWSGDIPQNVNVPIDNTTYINDNNGNYDTASIIKNHLDSNYDNKTEIIPGDGYIYKFSGWNAVPQITETNIDIICTGNWIKEKVPTIDEFTIINNVDSKNNDVFIYHIQGLDITNGQITIDMSINSNSKCVIKDLPIGRYEITWNKDLSFNYSCDSNSQIVDVNNMTQLVEFNNKPKLVNWIYSLVRVIHNICN